MFMKIVGWGNNKGECVKNCKQVATTPQKGMFPTTKGKSVIMEFSLTIFQNCDSNDEVLTI